MDLNRNYAFKFNSSEISSSSDPCVETYRGKYAFSEPESEAVKNFIESNPDIKIAYNYHAFGNFYVIPFNYLPNQDNSILKQNAEIYSTYQDFEKSEIFPKNNRFGNTQELLSYSSDGEASDWMLGEKNIIAFSPELGSESWLSETFYPTIETGLEICRNNLNAAIFGIKKSGYFLNFNNQKNSTENNKNNNYYIPCVDITNQKYPTLNEELNIIYSNQEILTNCENKKFIHSINTKIANKGLESFTNPGLFRITLISKGLINILGNLIKVDIKNNTITHLLNNYITESVKLSNTPEDNEKFPNFTFVEFNYTTNNTIEPNVSLIFDLKFFSNEEILADISFNLIVEFIYFVDNKLIRKISLENLNEKNFEIFDKDFNELNLNTEMLVISSEYVDDISKGKKYVYIIISVVGLFIIICFGIYVKKCLFKKKVQENKIAGKVENKSVKSDETPYIKNTLNIGNRIEMVTVVNDYENNLKIII